MSEDVLREQRLKKVDELRQAGIDPYANDFRVDTTVAQFVNTYAERDAAALEGSSTKHALAGRVMAINNMGKACFLRIQDGSADDVIAKLGPEGGGRLQLYVRREKIGEKTFDEVVKRLDLGDFVGVTGTAMRTRTGELSLMADSFRILTKSILPLPEKWHGLSDVEIRYRQRYLDLIVNPEVRRTFKLRSQMVTAIRAFFIERGFLEVETPMMQPIAGGAAARPFRTHHNTLDVDLYLRIAPELYLKRLVVGGLERVFEINRNFRNEGISTFHNPEFTMLEFYQAYATYKELMDIGEELISGVAQKILGSTEVRFEGFDISLARPFKRMTMLQAIEEHGGPAPEVSRDPAEARAILEKAGVHVPNGLSDGGLVVLLFEHFAEKKLIQPTFIYDFPAAVSPLARKKPSDPWYVDRFELFVAGRELANAFSELNDPVDQRQRFVDQLAAKTAGDEEAHAMDEDYVRALEHGMPPAGGFGLGIDRFAMLLSGAPSIRDVILFPQLRPTK
jgi:lysyl-tRNA synthetase, class II